MSEAISGAIIPIGWRHNSRMSLRSCALRNRSPVREFLQHRLEPNAAFAGKRSGLGVGAFIAVGAGKADADFMAAEHRTLALARRVLVIDDLALPFAVRGGVGAD